MRKSENHPKIRQKFLENNANPKIVVFLDEKIPQNSYLFYKKNQGGIFMLKETDLQQVKCMAKTLLYTDINIDEQLPFFCHHPFFQTTAFLTQKQKKHWI